MSDSLLCFISAVSKRVRFSEPPKHVLLPAATSGGPGSRLPSAVDVGFLVGTLSLERVLLCQDHLITVSYSHMYLLGNGQWARWRPQFLRSMVSPHRTVQDTRSADRSGPFRHCAISCLQKTVAHFGFSCRANV